MSKFHFTGHSPLKNTKQLILLASISCIRILQHKTFIWMQVILKYKVNLDKLQKKNTLKTYNVSL